MKTKHERAQLEMSKTELQMLTEELPIMSAEMEQRVAYTLHPGFMSSAIANMTL